MCECRINYREEIVYCPLHKAAPELLEALRMALRYLEHPDVLAITKQMAMPGSVIVERTHAIIDKAEGRG